MEDVLEVYKRPYDPQRPVVCLDETSKQLIGETRTPVPGGPGRVAHYDSEYVRKGVANLFMMFEPLAGHRRDRTGHPEPAVPLATHRQHGRPATAGQSLGEEP